MSDAKPKVTCQTCRFWDQRQQGKRNYGPPGGAIAGICRFRAPFPQPYESYGPWAMVYIDDWCGSHVPTLPPNP